MMTKKISVNEQDAVDMVEAMKEKVFKESDEDGEKVLKENYLCDREDVYVVREVLMEGQDVLSSVCA